MSPKSANMYVLRPGAATKPQQEESNGTSPIVIELSAAAREKLVELQLKSLDPEGRQPNPSQLIEKLINAAAASDPDLPYPAR